MVFKGTENWGGCHSMCQRSAGGLEGEEKEKKEDQSLFEN